MKTIFFDLDGTLLHMDLDEFVQNYYKLLYGYIKKLGYDPIRFIHALNQGVKDMIQNDGSQSSEQLFWKAVERELGSEILQEKQVLEDFYSTDFQQLHTLYKPDPELVDLVRELKKDYQLVLATNPLFPSIATRSRLSWAGFDPEDFVLITTYEEARHSKPNPAYYTDLLEKLDLKAEDVLMVGNDALEDGVIQTLNIPVFLLDHHPLNFETSPYPVKASGDVSALKAFISRWEEEKRMEKEEKEESRERRDG